MRIKNQWRWVLYKDWPRSGRYAILRLDLTHFALGFDINGREGRLAVGFGPVEIAWFYRATYGR